MYRDESSRATRCLVLPVRRALWTWPWPSGRCGNAVVTQVRQILAVSLGS